MPKPGEMLHGVEKDSKHEKLVTIFLANIFISTKNEAVFLCCCFLCHIRRCRLDPGIHRKIPTGFPVVPGENPGSSGFFRNFLVISMPVAQYESPSVMKFYEGVFSQAICLTRVCHFLRSWS